MCLVLPQMDLTALGWVQSFRPREVLNGSQEFFYLKKSILIGNSVFLRPVFAKALVLWECVENSTCHWYFSWALPHFQYVRSLVYCDTWTKLTMDKNPTVLQHSFEASEIWSWWNRAMTCSPVTTHWRPQESRVWLLISYGGPNNTTNS